MGMGIEYQTGFGNEFATEALSGVLPEFGNNPQKPAKGLYVEQISGTSFTTPRDHNRRTWVHRIYPSVRHSAFKAVKHSGLAKAFDTKNATPNQMRWSAQTVPSKRIDFVDGITAFCGNGSADHQQGLGVYLYAANAPMDKRYFYNADGDMLIVPQMGTLEIFTEMGMLHVPPGEICVIPRGIKFQVQTDDVMRGYICENYGPAFRLPDLGPIGANGLANPRDFEYPVARYEDLDGSFSMLSKYAGQLWHADIDHSPLNVVGWHGNYAPYKYDLRKFNTINTVSFDHPDPSIFTVLTVPTASPGVANIDFVIFPERWMVAENTFRPPYFHRNVMSEFMGLIYGGYDGKEGGGFEPGGASLHNSMSAHGPDAHTVEKAMNADLKPLKIKGTMAFMFESCFAMHPTDIAMKSKALQADYHAVWRDMPKMFEG